MFDRIGDLNAKSHNWYKGDKPQLADLNLRS